MTCRLCENPIVYCKGLCKRCYTKQRKAELKSRGICIECGTRPISNKSKSYCYKCLYKYRDRMREKRRKQRLKDLGLE
jgi:hypothetical protein